LSEDEADSSDSRRDQIYPLTRNGSINCLFFFPELHKYNIVSLTRIVEKKLNQIHTFSKKKNEFGAIFSRERDKKYSLIQRYKKSTPQ
jgi:hypothetical protein